MMTCYLFQKDSSKLKYRVFLISVLAVLVVVSIFLVTEKKKDKIENANELIFNSDKMIKCRHQVSNDNLKIELTVTPEEVKKNKVTACLANKSNEAQIWGERGPNLLLEKYKDGSWYYSMGTLPKAMGEMEYIFDAGSSLTYEYTLNDDISPGEYRFTALFQEGLVAPKFTVS